MQQNVCSKINKLMLTISAVVSSWERLSLFKHVLIINVAAPILLSLSAYLKIKWKCIYFYYAKCCHSLQD